MNENQTQENGFVGYEYQDITVKRDMASLYSDGYENFGWRLEGTSGAVGKPNYVTMKIKRDRKIRNKAELTRLQRQFCACAEEIQSLEFSKYVSGAAAAYVVGIIGTAFMAGSVFAITGGSVMGCILLAVPGFAGWIAPYLIYRVMTKKKTAQITPLIDKKHDEIYDICEKGSKLLG
ncbi:MAG: hypothetical protein GXZ14_01705 [Ruminococcaceae bacterium]|nr:hypothetical protein [Oscillospiraceae bacterium]